MLVVVEMAASAVAVVVMGAVAAEGNGRQEAAVAVAVAASLASTLPLLPHLTLATGQRLRTNWGKSFKRARLRLHHQ
jgi:hypothetical protein